MERIAPRLPPPRTARCPVADCLDCTVCGSTGYVLLDTPREVQEFGDRYAASVGICGDVPDVVTHLSAAGQDRVAMVVAMVDLLYTLVDWHEYLGKPECRICFGSLVAYDNYKPCSDCTEPADLVEPEGREHDKYTHGMVA